MINKTEASILQLIHFNEFKRPVSISYSTEGSDCPNCIYDNRGKISSGVYKTNGPQPFPAGTICPICKGKGKLTSGQVTEVLQALVEWNPARFEIPVPANAIAIPKGYVQLTFLIADFHKISKAKKLNYVGYSFIPFGEPVDTYTITPDEYIISIWKREGI